MVQNLSFLISPDPNQEQLNREPESFYFNFNYFNILKLIQSKSDNVNMIWVKIINLAELDVTNYYDQSDPGHSFTSW